MTYSVVLCRTNGQCICDAVGHLSALDGNGGRLGERENWDLRFNESLVKLLSGVSGTGMKHVHTLFFYWKYFF